jgi:reactive intermediate/imine deaminase
MAGPRQFVEFSLRARVLCVNAVEKRRATTHHARRYRPGTHAMRRKIIHTSHAPKAIGAYSQAVRVDNTVYCSGQIGLDPATMQMAEGFDAQIRRVLDNLKAVTEAAGGSLNDVVRFTVYLTDLKHFARVNEIMAAYLTEPYPARAAVGVASLPRDALVEIDAVMCVG